MSDVTKARDLVTGRYIQALQRPGLACADQAWMIREFEKDLEAYAKAQTPKPTLGQNGITIGQSAQDQRILCHVCPTPRVFVGIDNCGGMWYAFSAKEAIDKLHGDMVVVRELEHSSVPGIMKTTFHKPKNSWATLRAAAKQSQ